ncbi:hypothetical protein [Streptomyces gossypiisoli]|uniref:hypothetical protein n=1 Tax=Streptomyces TaxID=1883 RepID=UPI002F96AFC2
MRANWGWGPNLHDYAANLLTKNDSGQYLPLGEWFMYRYYGSQTGNVANFVPGTNTDGPSASTVSTRRRWWRTVACARSSSAYRTTVVAP